MTYPWHLYLMAGIYCIAGFFHFLYPKFYMRIIPQYLPAHKQLVYLSGAVEIFVGAGLVFPPTKNFSILAIIVMLVIFLLVHFNMIISEKAGAGISKWKLYLRIPLQFLLIWWAWYYLKF